MNHELNPTTNLCIHCGSGGGPPPDEECPGTPPAWLRVREVWAVFSAALDGDSWITFDLMELRAAPPPGMVVTTRTAFGSGGETVPEGVGVLPMAYGHNNPTEPALFCERLEVLP